MKSDLDTVSILLVFLMVSIMSIFSISLMVIMIRKSIDIKKLKRFGFLIIIIIYVVAKLILYAFLTFHIVVGIANQWENLSAKQIQVQFKNSLIIAEITMVQLFLVAFEFYIFKSISIIPKLSRIPSKLKVGFYVAQAIYLVGASTLMLLFNIEQMEYQILNLFFLIINCTLILCFLVSFFYLNFMMTGLLISEQIRDNINRTYKYVLLLLFSRIIVTGLQFLIQIQIKDSNFEGFIAILQHNRNQQIIQCLIFIGYIVYFLLTQGLPLMYSLRRGVINIFTTLKSESQHQDMNEGLIEQLNISPNQTFQIQSTYNEVISSVTHMDDFSGLQQIQNLQSDIWNYYRGHFQSKIYFIKKAKNPISVYLIEDAVKEIESIRNRNIRQLNYLGLCQDHQTIFLYEPYRFHRLIETVMKSNQIKEKIQLTLVLAQAIQNMHEKNFIHGCLSENNIFWIPKTQTANVRIKFSGYGLQSLKRYFSLTTDYTNKTVYTAPQYLLVRNNVILKPKKECDIYSFGMLFYELITNNLSYRTLSLGQLEKTIGQENCRPKIPEETNPQIKQLIRLCWSKNQNQRPKAEQLVAFLKEILLNC